jgi:hypothetical protein
LNNTEKQNKISLILEDSTGYIDDEKSSYDESSKEEVERKIIINNLRFNQNDDSRLLKDIKDLEDSPLKHIWPSADPDSDKKFALK